MHGSWQRHSRAYQLGNVSVPTGRVKVGNPELIFILDTSVSKVAFDHLGKLLFLKPRKELLDWLHTFRPNRDELGQLRVEGQNIFLSVLGAFGFHRQCWQTKAFRVLESINLNGRSGNGGDCESSFTWNEVIFDSVQASHVKRLDLQTYFQLKSPAARQAYRFLDKRFYRTRVLEFDLRAFACEHVGLSRNYDNGKLKSKLSTCLKELESIGFLEEATSAERYSKQRKGEWRIRLVRASASSVSDDSDEDTRDKVSCDLMSELQSRGVSKGVAKELADSFPVEFIKEKIAYVDSLPTGGKDAPKNRAGFLASAIRNDYAVKKSGVANEAKRQHSQQQRANRAQKEITKKDHSEQTATDREAREYFESLSDSEKDELEVKAIAAGNPFKVQTYKRVLESSATLA